MSRARKDGKYVNANINKDIYQLLEDWCNMSGQTKTAAVERALKQYCTEQTEIWKKTHKE